MDDTEKADSGDVVIGGGAATLMLGDCLERMRELADNSVDSVVTDPPYGLEFMGKDWDGADGFRRSLNKADAGRDSVFGRTSRTSPEYRAGHLMQEWCEAWARECLRVLKPGGHLLAFSGSRTYHRMACAIEDAGFEIRDQIMYVYGSGFPKSMNLDRLKGDKVCGCSEPCAQNVTKKIPERDLRSVRQTDVSKAVALSEERREVLQHSMPEQGSSTPGRAQLSGPEIRSGQSSLEGRGNAPSETRELRPGSVRESAERCCADGAQGRLRDGASLGNGEVDRSDAVADGGGSPCRSRSNEQRQDESGVVAGQSQSQTMGAWPVCGRCGLPRVPSGLGTALKPAHEPICMARKPLAKGNTVAANVLKYGTGAINVDGCRVATEDNLNGGAYAESRQESTSEWAASGSLHKTTGAEFVQPAGRWPANLILSPDPEVIALFPTTKSGNLSPEHNIKESTGWSGGSQAGRVKREFLGSEGSAARFFKQCSLEEEDIEAARLFYCAKVAKSERNRGLPEGMVNNHPTLKPVSLCSYLIRLITPPGGTVLDPFMGSGSMGVAAMQERVDYIGCELGAEYLEIAAARIRHAYAAANPEPSEAAEVEPEPQMSLFA